MVDGASFEVRAGEIFGIAGVAGNGQDELVEALNGLRRGRSGHGHACVGQDVTNHSSRDLSERGVAYIPGDRQRYGLVLSYPIEDNLVLTEYYHAPFSRFGIIDEKAITERANELIPEFDIRTPSGAVPASTLSGGNQQKVIVAREFSRDLDAARRRPADARDRRRLDRVHPQADRRQARRRHGRAARLRRARRGHGAVRPDRGHVPRPARGDPRRRTAPRRTGSA